MSQGPFCGEAAGGVLGQVGKFSEAGPQGITRVGKMVLSRLRESDNFELTCVEHAEWKRGAHKGTTPQRQLSDPCPSAPHPEVSKLVPSLMS